MVSEAVAESSGEGLVVRGRSKS
jgi:hypothetical protein